jgi:hypothetical protein
MSKKPTVLDAVVVFTAKSVETLLQEGGTSSWRLDRNHARQRAYAVCTRNANADWVEGSEAHHSAFLVGKVREVVPSPNHADRYLIQFSEYALLNIPDVWKGDRNPVKYAALEDLGIDPSTLKWEPMPISAPSHLNGHNGGRPISIAEAKNGLALTFGVSPDAVEITIRA